MRRVVPVAVGVALRVVVAVHGPGRSLQTATLAREVCTGEVIRFGESPGGNSWMTDEQYEMMLEGFRMVENHLLQVEEDIAAIKRALDVIHRKVEQKQGK